MMEKVVFSLWFIGILLCCSICSIYAQDPLWCVSENRTPDSKLQQVLDNVCVRLNCNEILPGGSCYSPNNYMNHGSYAIDLNYRVTGVCDESYAKYTPNDPSFGICVYP
ncbi:X8 domain-containing protein [Artemisia annua]|uniref:X8 domain-containing protein n=1 Tax=Artemisia annua TaxID=35608 RepID=A0A2U1L2S5_ARTAN|nr:X8 domain-containing protein [Artemisia annua]